MALREEALSEKAVGRTTSRRPRPVRSLARDEAAAAEPHQDERDEDGVEASDIDDDERFAMFQDSIVQSVLPEIPNMPGYHLCWLTTANPRDTIQNRIRVGYQLITRDMVPGWEGISLKSGEYSGVISVNEMVAARIPLRLYNRYMRELHETMPRSEEEKIKAHVNKLSEQAEAAGARIEEGDGTAEIVQRARPMPEFMS